MEERGIDGAGTDGSRFVLRTIKQTAVGLEEPEEERDGKGERIREGRDLFQCGLEAVETREFDVMIVVRS